MNLRRASAPVLEGGALLGVVALAGCDPLINIAGANFPAWLLCAIIGAILAAAMRPLFALTGLEPYLGPLIVIYPCLAVLLSCAVYLLFFGRT
ncbi:MAG: YtcA family lipoprotein [Candidatus Binataceae bacterium]